jgi:glyoxylase-like metal-dependent hydrolase (beta-lactamase superfamily II)
MENKNQLLEILKKMDAKPVKEGVYLIVGQNNGTFPYSNSLLILDDEVVLIDSGIGDDRVRAISDHVDILINSHYHIDHILGNYLIKEFWVVEEEAGVTSSFENYKRYAGIFNTAIESQWLSWFSDFFTFQPSSHTRTFKPNEVFNFGNTKWKAIHTPGHSPGHCVFYEPDRKIMFASDIDLTPFGPWYGNPNADLKEFIDSIKLLMEYDINIICSSHSFPQNENIREDLKAYLDIIYKRDVIILEYLEKEMTLEDLESKNIIYKESQKRYRAFAWFEKKMIEKHINILIEMGKVKMQGEIYKLI